MASVKEIALYIHQLPQNLIGKIVLSVTKASGSPYCNVWIAQKHCKNWSGVSLGKYVIISKKAKITKNLINHEKGHQVQSCYLGWLYLILIGLPSLIGNIVHRFIKYDYFATPWESTADKFGGVNRE